MRYPGRATSAVLILVAMSVPLLGNTVIVSDRPDALRPSEDVGQELEELIGLNAAAHDAAGPSSPRVLTPEWTFSTGAPMLSSPKLADVDGDDVLDVVLTTYGHDPDPYGSGWVHVLDLDGDPLPGWPFFTDIGPFSANASVGDVDGQPGVEVVAGDWYQLHVFDATGNELPGWPRAIGVNYTPALADLDGDGDLEIVVPSGNSLRAIQEDGTLMPGWPVFAPESIGSPAVGDIDGDGEAEVVAGTLRGPVGPDPCEVYVWELDGTVKPGFPKQTSGVCKGAPALGDIDVDGVYEIVIAAYDTSNNDYLYAWDADANAEPGWPVRAGRCRLSHPALADIDGDAELEIMIGGGRAAPPFASMVYAFEHSGGAVPGFPIEIPVGAQINSGPIVADIDGDPGLLEIVVKVQNYVYAYHSNGSLVADFPYYLSDQGHSGTNSPTPAMGDVDLDGTPELVLCSCYDQVDFLSLDDPVDTSLAHWPSMKLDAYNSSYLGDTATSVHDEVAGEAPRLIQSAPNPFNLRTDIGFNLPSATEVSLRVYDVCGRMVRELLHGALLGAGAQRIAWDGADDRGRPLASGIYFCRLVAGDTAVTGKVTVLR